MVVFGLQSTLLIACLAIVFSSVNTWFGFERLGSSLFYAILLIIIRGLSGGDEMDLSPTALHNPPGMISIIMFINRRHFP